MAQILERSFVQNATLECLASFEDLFEAENETRRPEPSLPRCPVTKKNQAEWLRRASRTD